MLYEKILECLLGYKVKIEKEIKKENREPNELEILEILKIDNLILEVKARI